MNGKNKTTFSEMIEMDIFYGKNMSVGLISQSCLRPFRPLSCKSWRRGESPLVERERKFDRDAPVLTGALLSTWSNQSHLVSSAAAIGGRIWFAISRASPTVRCERCAT